MSWSSKYLCYNYHFLYLQIWLLFYFHGSLEFSFPADIPVVKFLRDFCLLFSISTMCILHLLLKIWKMTCFPSGCSSLIVIKLSGEFFELSHLVENSNENMSNEESLEQEITDYLFFRRHDKLVNAHIFCLFVCFFSDKQSTSQFSKYFQMNYCFIYVNWSSISITLAISVSKISWNKHCFKIYSTNMIMYAFT